LGDTAFVVVRSTGLLLGLSLTFCSQAMAVKKGPTTQNVLERPNSVFILLGGQIQVREYRSFLKIGGGYCRLLGGSTWLDLSSTVLVHRNTNFTLGGGLRWKFLSPRAPVRPFVRTSLEFAVLREDDWIRYVLGLRGGGGVGFYPTQALGLTLEGSVVFGPAFSGGGTHLAAAVDILLGTEFSF
jgi:hypothetical protein